MLLKDPIPYLNLQALKKKKKKKKKKKSELFVLLKIKIFTFHHDEM